MNRTCIELRKRAFFWALTILLSGGGLASAETVEIVSNADATLYEGDGSLANGSGIYLFVGTTDDQNGTVERRSLVAFDIAGAIPDGATVTAAALQMTMSRTVSGAQTVQLRRVTESWNEGPSDAPNQEGGGTASQAGDVTWVHREFLSGDDWSTAGGSYSSTVSASQQISGNGTYVFDGTQQLVSDVQGWLDDPSTNFGWAVVMSSPPERSAKRFNSRENSDQASRPRLTVTYETSDSPDLAERYVFPASNAGGSNSSFFITSADILNAGSSTASIRIQLLPREQDNSNALESALFTLEPGQVRRFDNLLDEAFGQQGQGVAGGAAVLSDSGDLIVMTRTFDSGEEGTTGAAIPGVAIPELVQAGERVRVIFLTENDDFRSNLGLINGVNAPIKVRWELFDSAGTSLGLGSRDLDPYGVTQVNRLLRFFLPIEGGYAEVWTDTSGGAFTSYGSVIDNESSDPTLVIPR
jgi:hypothetical protein